MVAKNRQTNTDATQDYRQTWKELRDLIISEGWEDHWKELGNYFAPRKPRFIDRDNTNQGGRKNQRIINTAAIWASNTLASGMVAGVSSPTRPWFELSVNDKDLREFGPVKRWLEDTQNDMLNVFARSNIYKVFHSTYRDLGVFGTGSQSLEYDPKNIVRAYPYPIGSYGFSQDDNFRTDTFYYEIPYTVYQLVKKFGFDNVSDAVKNQYNNNNLNNVIKVVHGVEPNNARNLSSALPKDMPFKSVWYEQNGKSGKFLRIGGFQEFPNMTPRWMVTGSDSYGSSPGMDTLGINISVQIKEKRSNSLIDKMTDPPMVGPSSLQQSYASLIPGEITYIEGNTNNGKYEVAQKVDPNAIPTVRNDIREQTSEIDRAFFTDLFLMLSNSDRRNITATEVIERHEEKLLMLGPVLENVHTDLLDPTIDRAFGIMDRNGLIRPAPPELQGIDLKVKYVSILAQAQRAVGISSIEQTLGFAANIAQFKPDAIDKIDLEQTIDEVADMNGTPATIIRSDDEVKKIREKRAADAAAQQSAQNVPVAAETAKTLSETPVGQDGGNALESVINQAGAQ